LSTAIFKIFVGDSRRNSLPEMRGTEEEANV
jgi:hypothetical protein